MDIGKEKRKITVEPLREPAPSREPEPMPTPEPLPEREPARKEPAREPVKV